MQSQNEHQDNPTVCREGKRPHELFVLNLIFSHLLAVPAGLSFGFGYWGMLVPVISSSLLLLYYRNKVMAFDQDSMQWLQSHWTQGLKRFRWLYIGYAVVALLIGLVRLFVEPDSIAFVALTRVAVMPAILLVLATFVMSTAAIGRAGNGEL
ncbi:MAG: hypothetical protein HON68_10575 [Gammaproteobacteria bacterium]|jgi:hypothetical protein|nr:hypothetical protein [Gammaproteobacteria bacterium]MBT3489663.1 hypothetical protein [Gammaproteobacteria bacterium]MBT3718501.1 hypothetical protein [Gammaproteobacteria bacterium]MBT3843900.1 hypothetical protein [Gammaproteobacteria bacterium]MBT3893476.1 hypothetical protein [Gammaproteobacteria bacterium]